MYKNTKDSRNHFLVLFITILFVLLGHFLLAELLVPLISKTSDYGTILSVSSSYHFLGNASDLTPPSKSKADKSTSQDSMPYAARSDIKNYNHRKLAYGNNKLAQVLHMKELQKRLLQQNIKIRTCAICPGWVDTGILPDNFGGKIVGSLAFHVNEGILSTMCGLFSNKLVGGEFIGNSRNFWARQDWLMDFATKIGIKDVLCSFLAGWILTFQKFSYGTLNVEPSSFEANNKELQKTFYDWSKKEISNYI